MASDEAFIRAILEPAAELAQLRIYDRARVFLSALLGRQEG
jgi:hypothetical protein